MCYFFDGLRTYLPCHVSVHLVPCTWYAAIIDHSVGTLDSVEIDGTLLYSLDVSLTLRAGSR